MENDDYYSSNDEFEENEEEMLSILCLFCDERMPQFEQIFEHINVKHCVDLVNSCKKFQLDLYGFYKLINYIRSNYIKADEFEKVLNSKDWDSDKFLKPALLDDNFLMFDFDENYLDSGPSDDSHLIERNFLHSSFNDLESIKQFYKDVSLEVIFEDFLKLKLQYEETKNCLKLVTDALDYSSDNESNSDSLGNDCLSKSKKKIRKFPISVKNLDKNDDHSYIDSYSHYGIHHEMLHDVPRTLAYRDSILNNAEYFKGKTVLDIGCGTGILSMFAAEAGASLVVGIDQSDIAFKAKEIVSLNKLDSVIKIIYGKLESIDWKSHNLPSKFDIIISEWMGYFLLFEGMLDTVLYARDNFLNTSGKLLPNKSQMYLAAFENNEKYEENINFWNSVYCFDMTPIKSNVIKDASIDTLSKESICSTPALISNIDIESCSLKNVQTINTNFELNFKQSCTIHGLIGWFDCDFSCFPNVNTLSTSPDAPTTHWKQTIFYLKKPLLISAGTTLKGHLAILRAKNNIRALMVQIVFPELDLNLEYFVD